MQSQMAMSIQKFYGFMGKLLVVNQIYWRNIVADYFEVGCFILGFMALGFLINHTGTALYWAWIDWKYRKKK